MNASNIENTTRPIHSRPRWQRLLAERGILQSAEEVGWHPNNDGWMYPLFDSDGKRVLFKDKTPIWRWKNYDSEASPKYLWKPSSLGAERPKYYMLRGMRQAISNANGLLYIASGEPDVLAFRAAGILNTLCWFGEDSVPSSISEDLQVLGVNRVVYFPDLDATGRASASKLSAWLKGTTISCEIYALPDTLGTKGDINKLWQQCIFDVSRFRETLNCLSKLTLTEISNAPNTPTSTEIDRRAGYVRRAIDNEITLLTSTTSNRNIQLNKSAFALGQFIHMQVTNRTQMEAILFDAATSIGLGEREARSTIKSGLDAGERQPRSWVDSKVTSIASRSNSVIPLPQRGFSDDAPQKYSSLEKDTLLMLPNVEWLLPQFLPAKSLVTLFGPSGSGKSFVALDFGLRVSQQHSVMYVAAEGLRGYVNRMDAWSKFTGMKEGRIRFIGNAPPLLDKNEVHDFINAVLPYAPKLIILDTLARCMVGADENSSRDMGLVIAAIEQIQRATDATILLVHHTTKNGSTERGSSALRGACDVMIELTNDDGQIRLACSKSKDSEEFATQLYRLQIIEIEPGRTSCVIVPSQQGTQTTRDPLTKNQRLVLETLALEVFAEAGARTTAIIQASEISNGSIYRVLSILKRLGYVTQAQSGDPYFISEAGRRVLDVALSSPSLTHHDRRDG